MNRAEDVHVSTAYTGAAAWGYDAHRFTSRQGCLFSSLEFEQLNKGISSVPKGASVLEVGCGTGRFSKALAGRGYHVMATDPSPDMVKEAAAKGANLDGIEFMQAEGGHLPFEDSMFDVVFAIRVANQTESQQYALQMVGEMIRVAKPGGRILVEFVNRERPFARPSKAVRLSFDLLSQTASERGCSVARRAGVLVFSQSVLNRIPAPLIPVWGALERMAARVFWKWASRGYIVLIKGTNG